MPLNKRVLAVCDSEAQRSLIVAIGERHGFQIFQASHGDEALKLYRQHGPFALVLTDLYFYDEVPEPPLKTKAIRDGIQLALAIRKLAPGQKIVLQTASMLSRVQVPKGLSHLPVLQKPYSLSELESILERL